MRLLVLRFGITAHGILRAPAIAAQARLDRLGQRAYTLPPAIQSKPNPWSHVLVHSSHKALDTPGALTGFWLIRLLHRLQKIHRGQIADAWSNILLWLTHMSSSNNPGPTSPQSSHYMDSLSIEQRANAEFILAHIYVLKVKREVARGRHMGARGKEVGWKNAGDVRSTQVALISKAFNHACPGLLLNLLLDWNTGAALVSPQFLDNICAKYLTDAARIRGSLEVGRRIYDLVISDAGANRGVRTTGFVDALWTANNLKVAGRTLARLRLLEGSVEDSIISSLAIQLMQCACKASHINVASQIFDQYKPWLRKSPAAYNMLLHYRALAYDIFEVVAILKTMRANDVYPDAVTWTTIMSGMCLNGRIEQAMKLFALHLDFLPLQRKREDELEGDDMLYAPISCLMPVVPNLWQEWYANTSAGFTIHPYFVALLSGMAAHYQEPLSSSRRSRRPATDKSIPVPWLPTLATHKVLLKHLGRDHRLRELTTYYALLKRYWPHQYSQWSESSGCTGDGDGLRGIERMVRGYVSQTVPELRNIYGLGPDDMVGSSLFYYDYCGKILHLSSTPNSNLDSETRRKPDRLVFNKSLAAYALDGDIRTILGLMEKHPELHDVATWTELVRCVLTQIQDSPGDPHMLQPLASADWLAFLLDLEQRLSLRGIQFTQVTFGQIIQSAAQRSEFTAIPRVVEHMSQKSTVWFNVDMLRMVLGLKFPFHLKCELVKSTLTRNKYAKPDDKLLTLVARMAQRKEDVGRLPEIVYLFEQRYGVEMKAADYDYLASLCMRLGEADMSKYWVEARLSGARQLPMPAGSSTTTTAVVV
ncbi:hypothetical protein IWW37_005458 [Coemansia sp. RSA 2050]|nr:hypothetical protein IWW37_005458 [Coemansia sp. RSA 2050]